MPDCNFWIIAALGAVAVGAAATFYSRKNAKRAPVLNKNEFRRFPLVEKVVISHNTAVYKFGLPDKNDTLGLPIGQHISLMANIDGKEIMRSYTPTSTNEDKGRFDLLVKTYEKGNISRKLAEMKIGDEIDVRGPKGAMNYQANMCKAIGMIAGGTGITPMLQIVTAIAHNPEDKTKVNLIFANVNEDDILLKEELDAFAAKFQNINVYYVLNNPPEGWKGGVGFVSKQMIADHLPPPSADNKILLCGPPPMLKAMEAHCVDLGFDKPRALSKAEDMVFKF